mmetsp:Transcript_39218/g.77147  ORF Transcript_39218/g.77147 Transcript_39218/m.77147 type:complete len:155 (-) Transcript_39218:103-567(-)
MQKRKRLGNTPFLLRVVSKLKAPHSSASQYHEDAAECQKGLCTCAQHRKKTHTDCQTVTQVRQTCTCAQAMQQQKQKVGGEVSFPLWIAQRSQTAFSEPNLTSNLSLHSLLKDLGLGEEHPRICTRSRVGGESPLPRRDRNIMNMHGLLNTEIS